MRSYIKLHGPPFVKAIEALRKVAVDMPEVCIMDLGIETYIAEDTMPGFEQTGTTPSGLFTSAEDFRTVLGVNVPEERCDNLISDADQALGEYDFFFEWFKDPTMDQLNMLIEKIDEALEPLGRVTYTITTK